MFSSALRWPLIRVGAARLNGMFLATFGGLPSDVWSFDPRRPVRIISPPCGGLVNRSAPNGLTT